MIDVVATIAVKTGRNRRLAEDGENLASTLLAFVTLASIQLVIRRMDRDITFWVRV